MTQEAAGKDCLRGASVAVGDRGVVIPVPPEESGGRGAHQGLEGGVWPLILSLGGLGVETSG